MKKGTALVVVILVIAALTVGYFVVKQFSAPTPKPSPQTSPSSSTQELKTYQSEELNISITVPKGYTLEDEGIRILLTKLDGTIIITRNGTQFTSLDDYLENFDNQRKTTVSDEYKLKIDNYPSASRIIKYPGSSVKGEKIYIIYVGDAVYHISTNSESLYPDLDQIAQSFRYTP